jgi:LmbE family N-acetylglucosaminyl deacetylase
MSLKIPFLGAISLTPARCLPEDEEALMSAGGPLLAVSPHLDDAVLSVGATLAGHAEAGRAVVVCTVFAGELRPPLSDTAREFHAMCGLGDDAVAVRKAEDRDAVAAIGATALHWGFLDALYRRRGDGWLIGRMGEHFDPRLELERELAAAVQARLRDLVRSLRPAAVWTCAGIGDHVDHRVVLAAAQAACAEASVELALWEDLPYALDRSPRERHPPLVDDGAEPDVARKLDAIARYGSQLEMLFGAGADWRAAFRAHADARRAACGVPELVWRGR